MESRANPGLRSTSDEELDRGDLVHIVGEYREVQMLVPDLDMHQEHQ